MERFLLLFIIQFYLKKFLQQQSTACKSSIWHRTISKVYMRLLLPGKLACIRLPLRHPHNDMLLSCLSSPHLRNSAAYRRELISWRSSLFWSVGNSLANDEFYCMFPKCVQLLVFCCALKSLHKAADPVVYLVDYGWYVVEPEYFPFC